MSPLRARVTPLSSVVASRPRWVRVLRPARPAEGGRPSVALSRSRSRAGPLGQRSDEPHTLAQIGRQPQAREGYVRRWQSTQTRFVDDPRGAVAEADALVQEVMQERGYPTDDFDRRVADISVDHPDLVEKYRTAHGIAHSAEQGEASTEDMRHSVRHYRALFAELLETDDDVENADDVESRDEAASRTDNVARLR